MSGEMGDQIGPPPQVLRRRHDRMVPKRMQGLLGGKFFGHEAQLYIRADAVLQKTVINLVDVRKIVNGLTIRVFIVESDFIMKNRMKTDVLESCCPLDFAQVLPITVAKGQNRAPRTEHALPIVGKRTSRCFCIDFDGFPLPLRPRRLGAADEEEDDE